VAGLVADLQQIHAVLDGGGDQARAEALSAEISRVQRQARGAGFYDASDDPGG
jgi:hypothetical protein